MNLPTVTVVGGGIHEDGEIEYPELHASWIEWGHCRIESSITPGTYALIQVADGQTVTAEQWWWCEVVDRPAEDCELDDKYHRRAESHRVVSVLLVRGAADE